ncbi:hypothetical protein ACRYCC_34915 [Actinomadura scrupuli]|uniref:hypothetical protein n=1 Tax=Actinomadura scrupuli TaxID=559629 RepID=UPI003D9824DF
MMRPPTTYDPIIEIKTLTLLRLLSPLKAPNAGSALVLLPYEGAPVSFRHGEPIPSSHMGAYQYSYLVNLTEYQLTFDSSLVTNDPSFSFHSRVTLVCRVADPAVVVTRGIRDVTAALSPPIHQWMRKIARTFDISQFHQAEQALNMAFESITGDAAFRLRSVQVELIVDPAVNLANGQDYRKVRRDNRLRAMQRDNNLGMLRRDGAEGLLAEMLETRGPAAVLDWIAGAELTEREELRKTLDTVMGASGRRREEFDFADAEQSIMRRMDEGSSVAFGGTGSSRVRRARRGIEDGGPVYGARLHDEEPPLEDDELDDAPSPTPSRVRPPRDER